MQRFIIITDSGADKQSRVTDRAKLTGFLQGKGWHVWHWFEELWLVATAETPKTNPKEIRKEFQATLAKPMMMIVMEFKEGSDLSAHLPRSAMPWIRQHWR